MMTMKKFLYGNTGNTAKNITGLPIRLIRFNYSYHGHRQNDSICNSKFLWRHFSNSFVEVVGVRGDIIDINIID